MKVSQLTGQGKFALAATLAALVVSLSAPTEALADRKIFAYTYNYMTLPEGSSEIEYYVDAKFSRADDPDTPTVAEDDYEISWRHQLEYEYGILDNLDFGVYAVFEQKPFQSFDFSAIKYRMRYRFGEQGEFGIDPAIYVEAIYYTADQFKIEEMLILSKSYEGLEASLNLKFEQKFKYRTGEIEYEFVPSLGVGYHITPNFALGAEYQAKVEMEDGEISDPVHYAGPAISATTGSFWWTLGAQGEIGAGVKNNGYQVRSVFALVF